MKEIEEKLKELYDLLQTVPEECKGRMNYGARHRYLRIKNAIIGLTYDE